VTLEVPTAASVVDAIKTHNVTVARLTPALLADLANQKVLTLLQSFLLFAHSIPQFDLPSLKRVIVDAFALEPKIESGLKKNYPSLVISHVLIRFLMSEWLHLFKCVPSRPTLRPS